MRKPFFSVMITCCLLGGMGRAQSLLFVSPNTRGPMSDESALASLESFEQANFVAVANYLGTKLCPKPQVWNAEGMVESSTENSALVTGCKNEEARYLGELLGRYAHQKWILVFDRAKNGNQKLLVVTFAATDPKNILSEMRKFGVSAGTVVADSSKDQFARVYVWAPDPVQDAAIHAFARADQGVIEEIVGKGRLVGRDSRTAAQRTFDREIKAYERAHQRALSQMLWSRKLHDMGLPEIAPTQPGETKN